MNCKYPASGDAAAPIKHSWGGGVEEKVGYG
jgi:hypothetical protein